MEIGNDILRKRCTIVEDIELRSSKRRRNLDDDDAFSKNFSASSKLKVSNRSETENSSTEIWKPLVIDSFSESSQVKSKSKSSSSSAKMPTMEEIESFFSVSEKYEQKRFLEKYNFDVMKDVPMEEGRYEWIRIK
ncbi:cyclin-dependent kinase inhibitor 7-like [Impatiens glandulifera]|uniref:cyclin-dependent kinase inhibitor 7-like n=1 Tax=Impatiens glandulifera TaxID=253017 RepID=UPI001FB0B1DD|nr:cyclin-dependent kinase inhibitor 7-like [Impatiens glandulifera]